MSIVRHEIITLFDQSILPMHAQLLGTGTFTLNRSSNTEILRGFIEKNSFDLILLDPTKIEGGNRDTNPQLGIAFINELAQSRQIKPKKLHLYHWNPEELKAKYGSELPKLPIHELYTWTQPENALLILVNKILAENAGK